jgi:hypothetical protein
MVVKIGPTISENKSEDICIGSIRRKNAKYGRSG